MSETNNGAENERIRKIRERRQEKEAKKIPEPVKIQTLYTPTKETEAEKERKRIRRQNSWTRWFAGFLTLVFGGLAAGYAFLPQYRFSDIVITGMDKINTNEIKYFTGAVGKPVFAVNPSQIRSILLQRYQDIYDASVTIDFPAEMIIELEERIPVVEWDFGGSRFWIDKDGMVLNQSNSREETIHVYADSYPGSLSQEDRNIPLYFSRDILKTIITMGSHVPEGKPLIYTYKNGFGWDTDEGWRIFFGKNDADMDEKLRMQQSLTKYFRENDIQPILVSLEFKDAPYYRFVEN